MVREEPHEIGEKERRTRLLHFPNSSNKKWGYLQLVRTSGLVAPASVQCMCCVWLFSCCVWKELKWMHAANQTVRESTRGMHAAKQAVSEW